MRRPNLSRSFVTAFAVLLVTLLALPLAAQVDKAVLEVAAVDQTGAALPGVTVEIAMPDTGFRTSGVTGEVGVARFPGLTPGSYDVTISLQGFATVERKGLVLRVGQTRRIAETLSASASEEITVTAAADVVDVYRTDSATNIVPEQIQELPVADRDFQRLAFIAPGVQRERGGFRFIGGGPVVGSSGNASQMTVMVDGVDFTDEALGLARTRFSQDAIQEFRVINNRFDTEVGGSAGGALSIVTKSGTNTLSGSVFGFYRADDLRSAGALEQDNLPYRRSQFGLTLGGPIVLDKTHYFLSLENVDESNVVLFRPGGIYASQAADVEHPFKQFLGFASLSHQATANQSLMGKFVYEKYREDNFRVGGVADVSYGQELNRDNWNVAGEHSWIISPKELNQLRAQFGSRKYEEPPNSTDVAQWFTSGTTLQTGGNILGDLLGKGDYWEVRDTWHYALSDRHNLKAGFSLQRVDERSRIDTFATGLLLWATDFSSGPYAFPIAYAYGIGSSDISTSTDLLGIFIEDEWSPTADVVVNLGLRWDRDSNGNNPDFTHPLVPNGREVDDNNYQPRLSFRWDVRSNGSFVVRGGAGRFTGRYLLVPAFTELQQNGVTGRLVLQRVNGLLFNLPQFALDPNNPTTTGIPLPPDITLLDTTYVAPQSDQASLGFSTKLADTGLYLDVDYQYADGTDEIVVRDKNFGGNANPVRLNPAYNQINTYTNEGRSKYEALVVSLNGTLPGGHLITSSVTLANKKNIADDFSPDFPFGYPNDPANIDAEYGRSRADEKVRVVLSGIFRLPWNLTVAPIWEYGSGQPWNHRLGYDYNGDGKNSDRPAGVKRNSEDGPRFTQLSLRVTKLFELPSAGSLAVIAEAFNLFNTTNYDVSSVDGAEFLSGPTLANPTAAAVSNPNFGRYRSTLPGREIQLGLRYSF